MPSSKSRGLVVGGDRWAGKTLAAATGVTDSPKVQGRRLHAVNCRVALLRDVGCTSPWEDARSVGVESYRVGGAYLEYWYAAGKRDLMRFPHGGSGSMEAQTLLAMRFASGKEVCDTHSPLACSKSYRRAAELENRTIKFFPNFP